ncbi:MAG: hypothetical protein IJ617_03535 [Oscillospiraceae bacterium]|nr:hypothetical protein [Oscillospiraceae bacterium]
MNGKKFNWSLLITIVGLGAILIIAQSPNISNDALLPALGGLCLILGLISLRNGWAAEKRILPLPALQTGMGAVVLALGIVEALRVELPQTVWYVILFAILGGLIAFSVLRKKRKK